MANEYGVAPRSVWLLLAVASAGFPPASAGATTPLRDDGRAAMVERLEAASALLQTGRVADVVRAASGLLDLETSVPRSAPASISSILTPGLRRPVESLLGAVEEGGRVAREAVRVHPHELAAAAMRSIDLLTEAQLGRARDLGEGHVAALRELERLDAWGRRAVDREAVHAAGLMVADAIDRTLPDLVLAASQSGPEHGDSECDIAEQPKILCVGGLGSNTYVNDYALQIDLGGNDTYRNSAGGADLGVLAGGGSGPASVAIDLAGDDVYAATLPLPSGARVAQGGAFEGGIGILVDVLGNDRYRVDTDSSEPGALGQGYATAGVGILADLAGTDEYVLDDIQAVRTQAMGQGVTFIGGISAQVDFGLGNDSHSVLAHGPVLERPDGELDPGYHYAISFGFASLGAAAISYDDGGLDAFIARATAPAIAAQESRPTLDGLAVVDAFGLAGVGAAAISVTGHGDTLREATATAVGPTLLGAVEDGFGLSFGPSFAAVADASGDDEYVGRAIAHAVRHARIDDSCECRGVEAKARGFVAEATGLGFGWSGGNGLAFDASGDDAYRWTAELVTEATARDDREDPPEGDELDARAEASGGTAVSITQGGGLAGAGYFVDAGGTDSYAATLSNRTHAEASALDPYASLEAHAEDYQNTLLAQGSGYIGYGQLTDGEGSDSYRTYASSSVTAEPDTSVSPALLLSIVQGGVHEGGASLLSDVGGDELEEFIQVPQRAACQGARGGPFWLDCGSGVGVGINP